MATYLGHQEDSSGNILLPTPHSMATQIEFGTTASQAYAKGAYVVFNNRLCKASTAIASGDTLAIGTNLVQCSIGSELNSHLQAPNGDEFYFDYKDGKPGFYPSASKVASEFVPFGGSKIASVVRTTINHQSVGSTHFDIGFRPAYLVGIVWMNSVLGSIFRTYVYDADVSTTRLVNGNFGTGINEFRSIDDDGFTINGHSYTIFTYFAVGE